MKTIKNVLLIIMVAQLAGCVVTPRLEFEETLTFDHVQPEQKAMSYNDELCCWRCSA